MTATTTCEATATPATCPHCRGEGCVGIWVDWSDGMGGSSATCPLCEGKKVLDFDPCKELVALRQKLSGFLYKVWLIAGCYPTVCEVSKLEPHEQAIRNEVLRLLMEFPQAEAAGCDLKKPQYIIDREREVQAEKDRQRAQWQAERRGRRRY